MSLQAELFVDSRDYLGEGPIWHPARNQLFWFDIVGQKLHNACPESGLLNSWSFDEPVAAAGVIDENYLLIVGSTELIKFSIDNDTRETIMPFEADNAVTRANDSRVNPAGGFWLGTMGRKAEPGVGSVYQYRQGILTKLMGGVSIPNATCFSADGTRAYWTDTPIGIIKTCKIDPETGLPVSEWETHIDTNAHRGKPDGAVMDGEGYLWNARWGGGCVIRYAPDGSIDQTIELPVSNVTCPAFGGDDLKTLFITSARQGLSPEQLAEQPHAGSLFMVRADVAGLKETPVLL